MEIYDLKSDADLNRLAETIKAAKGDNYAALGLRGLHANEIGIVNLLPSYHWDDGERSDDKLGGTSVVGIVSDWDYADWPDIERGIATALKKVQGYNQGHGVAIVIGKYLKDEVMNDDGEYILGNARVVGYATV